MCPNEHNPAGFATLLQAQSTKMSFINTGPGKMASQRKHRLNAPQPLAPVAYLCVLLVLTVTSMGSHIPSTSLLCNFCPLQHKGRSCSNDSTTECLPQERCGTSSGRFGSTHILSAQGCLTPDLCNSTHAVTYRGVSYNVTYRCCCSAQCNQPPASDTYIQRLLGVTSGHSEKPPTATDPLDRCPGDEDVAEDDTVTPLHGEYNMNSIYKVLSDLQEWLKSRG
ncbi:uncharacterized protein LOC129861762 [Salvelinus fontinalis]|uniref:uncharacterized protein LOC129861762 n=1 Tax=Salvelinus fontinalis TaxID=8038 RepID=UPI00248691BF|nr:uncharacterized protein LOC129861762 [Salvelinus fontinalis]